MSDKVSVFCNAVHEKLANLDGRMESLKSNIRSTWHSLQEKLDEVRDRDETHREPVEDARARLEQWIEKNKLEPVGRIDHWRRNQEFGKLAERAQQAEDHAGYAIQIAVASVDDAERMILEAISARLDAESVQESEYADPKLRQPVADEPSGDAMTQNQHLSVYRGNESIGL